jgi:hypothetical protein
MDISISDVCGLRAWVLLCRHNGDSGVATELSIYYDLNTYLTCVELLIVNIWVSILTSGDMILL